MTEEEIKELLADCGISYEPLAAGTYTLKVYKDSISAEKLLASKDIKVISGNTTAEVDSVKLSDNKLTYSGKSRIPTLTIKDTNGNTLVKGTDYSYTIKNSSGTKVSSPKSVGSYTITIKYLGKYKDNKSSSISYYIIPKAVTNFKAQLTAYNKVKVSWSKSTGATGYYVYYKKNSDSSYSSKNRKTVTGIESSIQSKTTLKKISGVKVSRSKKNVTISWKNISGESGYQISRSTKKAGTDNVKTYSGSNLKSKSIKLSAAKKYYYKVRAYKTEGNKKIYGPWSAAVYK